MSNSDSFIDEVAEEVRRDKLYGYLRRYGWIAVLAVLGLVGGAAWNEYRNATARNAAEATGDALLSALNEDDIDARAAAIAQIPVDGDAAAVTALLTAATQQEAEDFAAARVTLDALAADAAAPDMYRDLAALKSAMLPTDDAVAQALALEQLVAPGQPFRLLALEQLAYAQLAADDTDTALETLRTIAEDAEVVAGGPGTRGLQERAQNLMVALGEPLPEPQTE